MRMNGSASRCVRLSCLVLIGVLSVAVQSRARGGQSDSTEARQDLWRPLREMSRRAPAPAPDQPGNVFGAGEEVNVKVPAALSSEAVRWRTKDDRENTVGEGTFENDVRIVKLGNLGIICDDASMRNCLRSPASQPAILIATSTASSSGCSSGPRILSAARCRVM